MTKQYLISEQELKQLEEARLMLVELGENLSPQVEFELSKVQRVLWKTVNLRREEGVPTVNGDKTL